MEITVQEILRQLSQRLSPHSETVSLDAQVLVAHHLGEPRAWVLAHPEACLNHTQYDHISQSLSRLEQGEPLPYVIGHWEFYGLDFILTPDVLIPRPETELLVERAIQWLQVNPHRRAAVDMGTGSGCIGVAIARHVGDLHVFMVDRSARALNIARLNAEKHGVLDRMEFHRSDLLSNLTGSFDLVCANLPYIPTRTLKNLAVAKKEPRSALDGGADGTRYIQRLLKQAKNRTHPGSLLLLEMDPAQSGELASAAKKAYPTSAVQVLKDLAGRERCLEIALPETILHLCQAESWHNSQAFGEYRAESLEREGFIHCSLPEQISDVAKRFYKRVPDLVVLYIDTSKLAPEVRWEKSGDTYYPHVYGAINLDAVMGVTSLHPDRDGAYADIPANSPISSDTKHE